MTKPIEERDRNLKPNLPTDTTELRWLPSTDDAWTVRGLAWYAENGRALRRLPARAKAVVNDNVWALGQHSTGGRLCFRSDTTTLRLRAKLIHNNVMSHMPLTGSSGLALYEGEPRQEKPWPVAFPGPGEIEYERELFRDLPRQMRTFTLYLPLYNGLDSLELGIDPDARIEAPPAPAVAKPVVFYGTSITQGGCAHNPGADYPAIVGRHLNLDVINLGFSGNGRGEPEVARLIAEIDASLFVLDYVANSGPDGLEKTLPGFVDILRERYPTTPIALVGRIVYSSVHVQAAMRDYHERQRDVCIQFYADRRRQGDQNLHFIDGNSFIPYGTELAYSDNGVHPSNVGFAMMAQAITPQIAYILEV